MVFLNKKHCKHAHTEQACTKLNQKKEQITIIYKQKTAPNPSLPSSYTPEHRFSGLGLVATFLPPAMKVIWMVAAGTQKS